MAVVHVRPPKWETLPLQRVPPPLQLEPFKQQQQKTLARFRELAQHARWSKLHNDHFVRAPLAMSFVRRAIVGPSL